MGVSVHNFLGGVGGLEANIFVTGLESTDSVSATSPSGKTIQAVWGSYVVEGATTQCFKITASEYGTYHITATREEQTTTADVLVDVATDYEIEMGFKAKTTYLYYLGDECVDITGGIEIAGASASDGYGTKQSASITTHSYNSRTAGAVVIQPSHSVDLTDIVGICACWKINQSAGGYLKHAGFFFNTSKGSAPSYPSVGTQHDFHSTNANTTTNYAIKQISLTASSNEQYCGYYQYCNDYSTLNAEISMIAIFEADDISGLSDYGTTIEQIILNASALLNSESGVNAMLKCTGNFMWRALAESSFISAINSSPYKATIQANSHWAKALALL